MYVCYRWTKQIILKNTEVCTSKQIELHCFVFLIAESSQFDRYELHYSSIAMSCIVLVFANHC